MMDNFQKLIDEYSIYVFVIAILIVAIIVYAIVSLISSKMQKSPEKNRKSSTASNNGISTEAKLQYEEKIRYLESRVRKLEGEIDDYIYEINDAKLATINLKDSLSKEANKKIEGSDELLSEDLDEFDEDYGDEIIVEVLPEETNTIEDEVVTEVVTEDEEISPPAELTQLRDVIIKKIEMYSKEIPTLDKTSEGLARKANIMNELAKAKHLLEEYNTLEEKYMSKK